MVRYLNRLESVTETLRTVLNAIAEIAPQGLYERITDHWINQYSRRIEEYRLPKGEAVRNEYGALVGERGLRLLTLVDADEAPPELKKLKIVDIMLG